MAEAEFGGVKFKGGKIFVLLTALSTLGGVAWGGLIMSKLEGTILDKMKF